MSEQPELLPESFLRGVLSEFGLQWTHVAIFSGVAISSLGLEDFLNPGLWMVCAIVAFTGVYLFRRQITGDFPRAFAIGLSVIVVGLSVPAYIISGQAKGGVALWAKGHRGAVTAYAAFATLVPLAYAIGSYRKQETLLGGPFPRLIRDSIVTQLVEQPLYRKDQTYQLEIVSFERGRVTIRTRLTYVVVNRTRSSVRHDVWFRSSAVSVEYRNAVIGGKAINPSDPEYRTERGLRIACPLPPGGEVSVDLVADEIFDRRGTELFGAFLPTTELRLSLDNPWSHLLDVHVETSLPEPHPPNIKGAISEYRATGLLPFQGYRLHWRPAQV
jgi:hypothetical protein